MAFSHRMLQEKSTSFLQLVSILLLDDLLQNEYGPPRILHEEKSPHDSDLP
jgi:hypothetical protein